VSQAFAGKVALVTGGGGGIGRAAVLAFARAGAKVAVADIADAAGRKTVELAQQGGGTAVFVKVDVTQASEVENMVAQTVAAYGSLDCAFNNAGIEEEHMRLADCPEATFDRVIGVNVKGVWLCMKYELAQMQKQGGGSIVNTASIAGLNGAAKMAAYSASKHAVLGLTKSAAIEYARKNIRVNAVCPAVIRTEMYERALAADPAIQPRVMQMHPVGRIGEVDEIAAAVLWLSSPAASFVTGHPLAVDGGVTAT
jgi:NAD(P)-dependent dehydrogenase (short-subunit alcohol dehydrogenase family)